MTDISDEEEARIKASWEEAKREGYILSDMHRIKEEIRHLKQIKSELNRRLARVINELEKAV